MQQLLKEAKGLFLLSKEILIQLLLILLSSFGGTLVAITVVLGIILWNLSKNRLGDALILFLVILLFSDSVMPMFERAGNAKEFVVMMLFVYIITKTENPIKNSLISYFWAYLFVALLGLVLVNFEFIGFQKLVSYGLMIFIVPAAVLHLLNKPGGIVFLRKLLFVFVFLYGLSILMAQVNPDGFAHFGRFNGIHRNPNGVGIFSALFVMCIALIRDKYPKLFSNTMFWAFIGVFLITIVISSSRSALLALIIFLIFRTVRIKFFMGLVITLVIASSYAVITVWVEKLIIDFGLQSEFRLNTISYASGRIYVWDACWREIQSHYWLGYGFTYAEYSHWDQKWYAEIPMLIHNYGNIHNSYLTIWLNTGLLGLVTFLSGLIYLVFKAQRKSPSIAPMFFGAVVIAIFESYMVASLNPYTWQLWFGFTIAAFTPKKFIRKTKISNTNIPLSSNITTT
ncbi:MAG: O-antigen ligase family protein [Bacteroidetes bacterium]|nr:O-antigen ligase family protein [Bacteroidota bacterium]